MLFGWTQIPGTAVRAEQRVVPSKLRPDAWHWYRFLGAGHLSGWSPPVSCTRMSKLSTPVGDAEAWVAGAALSAGSHLWFFFFFCKERNIRKTFALTLNPPPHVTVIAGPGGRKRKYHSNLGPTSLDNIVLNLLKSWSQAAASPPPPPPRPPTQVDNGEHWEP